MVRLSQYAETTNQSQIRKMKEKVSHSDDLARLEVGDPNFDTPIHIVEAAFDAARNGATHYTSGAGIPKLRIAIADMIQNKHKVSVNPETEVVVTTSGNEAVQLALLSVVDKDQDVVIVTPAWPNYEAHIRAVGGNVNRIALDAEEGFDLDPAPVIEAIKDDTAAVILTSPSNPTGRVYDESDVREIIEIASAHEVYILADEVYDSFIFDKKSQPITNYAGDEDYVISINSFSKRFAMTGWRVGWLTAHSDVANAAKKLHQACTSCAPTISQHAALAGLTGPQEPIKKMKNEFRERRDFVIKRVAQIPHLSCPDLDGGFFAFLDISAFGKSSFDVAKLLMAEYNVLAVPGTGFGEAGKHHLRISIVSGFDDLRKGIDRIEKALAESQ